MKIKSFENSLETLISREFFVYLRKLNKDMFLVKKLMVFVLMFAILIVLKEAFLFAMAYIKTKTLEMSRTREIILGLALSYILTIIFTGFRVL